MAQVKGLLNKSSNSVVYIKEWSIEERTMIGEDGTLETRSELYIDAAMAKSVAQAKRDLDCKLDEYEKVVNKHFTVENAMQLMTGKSDGTLNDGERLKHILYEYLKSKLGKGWEYIY